MSLDTPTVSFILVLVLCLQCGILTALWAIQRDMRGPGYWAAGGFSIALGVLVIYLRGPQPFAISAVAANIVIYCGFLCTWLGSEAFFGRPLPYKAAGAILTVAVLGLLYFNFIDMAISRRIAFMMSVNALIGGLRSYSMLRDLRPGTRFSQLLAGVPLALQGCFSLFIAAAALRLPATNEPLMQQAISGWIFLVPLLLSIVIVFGATLLVNQTIAVKLKEAARRDSLTDVLIRRAVDEAAEIEIARSSRHQMPFSVLLLDIDHFKQVNDLYGHPVGDAVLRRFAATTQQCLRREDIFGRFGGEEFCALLPNTPSAGALQLAERIRTTVAEQVIEVGGHRISLKVSIGVATLGTPDSAWPDLVRQADTALYAAKRAGRNRVAMAG